MDDARLDERQAAALLRWRLVLGKCAERAGERAGLFALAGLGGKEAPSATALAGVLPPEPEADVFGLDGSLEFVYEPSKEFAGYDLSGPIPHIPRWLADVRRYFPNDVVALIQKDAVERKGLKQLIFDPETLPKLEKNVDLLATIVSLSQLIPEEVRDTARLVVREIAEEIRKKLEPRIRTAVFGALNRNRHSAIPVYRNVDWKRTIQRNLKNYDRANRRLTPERFYFWANERKLREWHVVVCVDQSGSMGTSVVYSSIMASIFASLSALKTSMVLWSTEVLDVTDLLQDPVDILFGPQLSGGNDAPKAIAYCKGLVQNPERTIFVFISDLFEGAGEDAMVAGLRELVESKVKVICLLALSDAGKPSYNHKAAKRIASFGAPVLACTPSRLIEFVEAILQGREIDVRAATV
jgi:hypothetical protein